MQLDTIQLKGNNFTGPLPSSWSAFSQASLRHATCMPVAANSSHCIWYDVKLRKYCQYPKVLTTDLLQLMRNIC